MKESWRLFHYKEFSNYFNSFSISSILGNELFKSFGSSSLSSYSDIPMGKLVVSNVYCATTLFLFLQINNPIVGLSCGCFI